MTKYYDYIGAMRNDNKWYKVGQGKITQYGKKWFREYVEFTYELDDKTEILKERDNHGGTGSITLKLKLSDGRYHSTEF